MRMALKVSLQCSRAELVYGTTLCLPGELFYSDTSLSLADTLDYVTQLKATMSKLRAPLVRQQDPRKTHVHSDHSSCTHVYIRHDGVRKPLQRPYDSPYQVLQKGDKQFTVEIKGQQDVVSLD